MNEEERLELKGIEVEEEDNVCRLKLDLEGEEELYINCPLEMAKTIGYITTGDKKFEKNSKGLTDILATTGTERMCEEICVDCIEIDTFVVLNEEDGTYTYEASVHNGDEVLKTDHWTATYLYVLKKAPFYVKKSVIEKRNKFVQGVMEKQLETIREANKKKEEEENRIKNEQMDKSLYYI